ncbi:hypothetical protein F4778DRAFT_458853 [Xylariomycetidae sp. FL2044]|nr:hypothetical protein F4778DRAFT_458853 [Xylariomycetidae sp. FL2044]
MLQECGGRLVITYVPVNIIGVVVFLFVIVAQTIQRMLRVPPPCLLLRLLKPTKTSPPMDGYPCSLSFFVLFSPRVDRQISGVRMDSPNLHIVSMPNKHKQHGMQKVARPALCMHIRSQLHVIQAFKHSKPCSLCSRPHDAKRVVVFISIPIPTPVSICLEQLLSPPYQRRPPPGPPPSPSKADLMIRYSVKADSDF